MNCPKCKNDTMELSPHPDNPKRVQGFCPCNPAGPVLETNAPKSKRRTTKSEVENGNTE